MSFRHKIWALPDIPQETVASLSRELGVSPAIASVYLVRGIDCLDSLKEFNELDRRFLHSAFLLPDMDVAVDRLCRAMRNNERVMVIGDGDCDGITATALLVHALRSFGMDADYLIPSRLTDGFGLKPSHVDHAKHKEASLVVTVDCGTEALDAAQRAQELGIDLVITDHHVPNPDTLPHALAIINPQRADSAYPFRHLAGVGVALKLVLGIAERIGANYEAMADRFSDLVALGTVADMSLMLDENRILTYAGCSRLTYSYHHGIRALLKCAGIQQVDTTAIGYCLAPAINAAGRLGKPSIAVDLLLERDPVKAKALAEQLRQLNVERKLLQQATTEEVLGTLPDEPTENVIVAAGNWHPGVVGLVAGKLVERFSRPALVCSMRNNGMVRGSLRSVPGFDILEALRVACADLPVKFGGHAQAAGLEITEEHLPILAGNLNEYAGTHPAQASDLLEIDARLPFSEIDPRTHRIIARLAPFGTGNQEPVFLTEGLMVMETKMIGDGRHLKMSLGDLNTHRFVQAVGWNMGSLAEQYPPETYVDVVHRLSLDGYRRMKTLVLTVEDIRHSAHQHKLL